MQEYSLSLKGITFIRCEPWHLPGVAFLRKRDLMLPRAALPSSFSDLLLISKSDQRERKICIPQSFYSS